MKINNSNDNIKQNNKKYTILKVIKIVMLNYAFDILMFR